MLQIDVRDCLGENRSISAIQVLMVERSEGQNCGTVKKKKKKKKKK